MVKNLGVQATAVMRRVLVHDDWASHVREGRDMILDNRQAI